MPTILQLPLTYDVINQARAHSVTTEGAAAEGSREAVADIANS